MIWSELVRILEWFRVAHSFYRLRFNLFEKLNVFALAGLLIAPERVDY